LSSREHERNRVGLSRHVTPVFQIANVKTSGLESRKTAGVAEWCDPFE